MRRLLLELAVSGVWKLCSNKYLEWFRWLAGIWVGMLKTQLIVRYVKAILAMLRLFKCGSIQLWSRTNNCWSGSGNYMTQLRSINKVMTSVLSIVQSSFSTRTSKEMLQKDPKQTLKSTSQITSWRKSSKHPSILKLRITTRITTDKTRPKDTAGLLLNLNWDTWGSNFEAIKNLI